ncbi:hypothetical protein [Paraburkholderia sp. BCC1886]|uniref:hypothetical protein n=1 Tax=Paraburkholderia sp. BCC1886 TaxID=2562670 RepID=UPI001184138B|nr:hypothetical protein [Paraburkholderia sp. BCC1886]
MTKKSRARIQRDVAEGKRKAAPAAHSFVPQRQPVQNLGGGQFQMSAADRILAECRAGKYVPEPERKNTCWDDLLQTHAFMTGLLLRHTSISEVLRDEDLKRYIAEPETFRTNVNQFASDLRQMSEELVQLRQCHVGKTGGSTDPDELIHAISLHEQYLLWQQKHDAVVMPTVLHVLEATNQAELARANATGQLNGEVPQEEIDPAVLDVNAVTDVDFSDENVGKVVGVPETKPLRGHTSVIYQVDEAPFFTKPEHDVATERSL